MKTRIFQSNFEGHKISFTWKTELLSIKADIELEIDGQSFGIQTVSLLTFYSSSQFSCEIDGETRIVELRTGNPKYSLKFAFQIRVDGAFIDGYEALPFVEVEDTQKIMAQGFALFFVKHGMLRFGLPVVIMMSFIDSIEWSARFWGKFIFMSLFMGATMSIFSWLSMKKLIEKPSNR